MIYILYFEPLLVGLDCYWNVNHTLKCKSLCQNTNKLSLNNYLNRGINSGDTFKQNACT